MSSINFQSINEIESNRQFEREARQNILDKAKKKYENELRKEREAKERGETSWMLSSVEEKINPKKKKKHEKKKKRKKEKKSKKKKQESSASLSSASESENDTSQTNVWVEKSAVDQPTKRDEWMELPALFKTQTREQMKIEDGSSRELQKLQERRRKEEVNKPGSHARELNPYYKDGGIGVPSQTPSPTSKVTHTPSYDASWLRKALQRAKDQATEEGKTLEEVAKERWGSLDTFYKLLDEAEGNLNSKDAENLKEKCRNRDEDRRGSRSSRESYKSRSRSKNVERSRSRSRDKEKKARRHSRERDGNKEKKKRDRSSSSSNSNGSVSSEEGNKIGKKGRSTTSKETYSKYDNYKGKHSTRNKIDENINRKKNDYARRHRSYSSSSSSRSDSSCSGSGKEKKKRRRPEALQQSKHSISSKPKPLLMRKPESDDESYSNATATSFLKPAQSNFSIAKEEKRPLTKSSTGSWRKQVVKASDSNSVSEDRKSAITSSSSSSSSESEDEPKSSEDTEQTKVQTIAEDVPLLTDKEMNQLAAKLTKAELLGNTELVAKLKLKLDAARTARKNRPEELLNTEDKGKEEDVVVLTRTDRFGFTRPVQLSQEKLSKKKKKAQVFDIDGKRNSYFADDFKADLQSMFEKEKTISAADQIAALEKLSCSNVEKLSDDFDVDDMFIAKVAPKESGERERERDKKKAIWEHQKTQKALDNCNFCVDSHLMKKHLIVALGKKCYVSVPYHQSLTEGHCFIVPLNHVSCGILADEDLWEEVLNFRQALVRMFSANDEDCIFFETATRLHQMPHMIIQCVPLPRETGDLAPIYFKKAILECDEEWAQNKKLIDLKGKSVRKAVPKGLPYFSVEFGMTPGFAHVVENERLFPNNFAQEIIGGMIDAEFSLYRKPKAENFDVQRKKVLKFAQNFKPFDPTQVDS